MKALKFQDPPRQIKNTFLYFIHTPDKQVNFILCSKFHKNYVKSFNESNTITNHNEYPIKIKSSNVSVQRTNHN
jgi:hypothetical protein